MEEKERILALASDFDDLLALRGWKEVLQFGADRVNDAIIEATKEPEYAERQRINVIRWDAKRELLDSMLNYIVDTHKQREEIRNLQKQIDSEVYHRSIGCYCSTPWECQSLGAEVNA